MTAPRKNTPARKPATKKPTPGAVNVADLPDNQAAQVNEAMEEPTTFAMGNDVEFQFKPIAEWSFKASQAFARGDITTWLRGALAEPDRTNAFLDSPSRIVGRIIRYFDEQVGATRGEDSSSSTS